MNHPRYNKEWAQEYYKKNKEVIKERNRQWRKENPEHMKALVKKYKTAGNPAYDAYNHRNYEKFLLQSASRNSVRQGVPFNLEIEDIIIPDICPLLEIPLTRVRGNGRMPTNASIDRTIPNLGYVKGNVKIMSEKANRMKQDASLEELLTFAKNIISQYP